MKRLVSLFALISLFIYGIAQEPDLNFTRVSPDGGLNFQHIHSLTQDAEGNIWMGSNQGVYKYNPVGFKRFHHNPKDSASLRNDIVNQLLIDQNNKLWVATNSGIDLFNPGGRNFIHFSYKTRGRKAEDYTVHSLAFDKNETFWIVDEVGIGRLDTIGRIVDYLDTGHLDSAPHLIHFDKAGIGWVGTTEGTIYEFNSQNGTLHKLIEGPGSYPHTVHVEDEKIYVGYQSHGAAVFSKNGTLVEKIEYEEDKKWDLKKGSVRAIVRDNNQTLWIGAYSGLFLVQEDELVRINSKYHHTALNKSVYSIFQDRSGKLWFGAWSGGLFYLNEHGNNFQNYRYTKEDKSISDNIVSSFVELKNGFMLVGTEVGGLNKFDPDRGTFETIEIGESLNPINIKTLAIDKNNTIWVGTFRNKLWYKKSESDEYIQVVTEKFPGFPETVENVYALEPCPDGVWIGTYGNGVFFYEYATETIFPLSDLVEGLNIDHLNLVRSLHYDSDNNLWVGTNYGMSRFKLSSGNQRIEDFNSRLGTVYYIDEINKGEIWIGTKAIGIRSFYSDDDTVKLADNDSLFSGKDVYGFIQDERKNLWVTTNTGLYLYNPKLNNIRMFNEVDGIQGNQFNPQAIYRNSHGNLFFGGTNGFTVIDPDEINFNPRAPESIINRIVINNEYEVYPVFKPETSSYESLELEHNENVFNLEFSCDNYLLPRKNNYKYRLVGMYDEWIDNETNNNAVFTNIPPGEYTFEVRAANNDGVWSISSATIPIKINVPWWQSVPAFLAYFAVLVTILWIIYKARRERINLKRAILVERIRHEHEDYLHEAKLKFFTNISHEIRTPLTLIAGSLNSVFAETETLTGKTLEKLKLIQRNTGRLLTLINQLLDFRKLENGNNPLMLTQFHFSEFINNCFNYFVEEANEKGIRYGKRLENDLIVQADEEKLDKVFVNLLSNAFKYTRKDGEIIVVVDDGSSYPGRSFGNPLKIGELLTDDFLQISVIDSGAGINNELLVDVFDRFEKGMGRESGSGLGLAICKEFILLHNGEILISSQPGKGTCISVRIPCKQTKEEVENQPHYAEKQLKSSELFLKTVAPLIPEKKDGKRYNILIVDDNEEMLHFLSSILSPYYNVKQCLNGSDAIVLLRKDSYDLVLSDVMMPETNGFELCSKIKDEIATSHIPVVLLTALSSENNQITGLSTGADDYIVKPFNNTLLISRIGNLLRQREDLKNSFEYRFINNNKELVFQENTQENYFLKKITDIIEFNLTNTEFGVESLSKDIGMSRGNLHRKLKQLTNYGPNEYIRMIKLKKGAELLKSGEYNIDEIVFQLGFNSSSYFIKCFKAMYKETPKQFMKSRMIAGEMNRNEKGDF